ncbi:MAG: hypothetical protein ISS79_06455 [Phycisphaerae bacterium]|nr:hypothetical protein [Phycisphaerae bacterium]
MLLLKTRHSEDFDPLSSPLDRSRSPYAESYDDYPARCQNLAALVGYDSFLWCYPAERQIPFYEGVKLVEWVIEVSDERILGSVDDARWVQYVKGGDRLPRSVFSKSRPPSEERSILVAYPLKREELVSKTVFEFISPTEANVVSVDDFRASL